MQLRSISFGTNPFSQLKTFTFWVSRKVKQLDINHYAKDYGSKIYRPIGLIIFGRRITPDHAV